MANQDVFTKAFLQFQHLIHKGITLFLQLFSLIFNCPKLVPPFQSLWKHMHMDMDKFAGNKDCFWSSVSHMKSEEHYFLHSSLRYGKEQSEFFA